MHKMGAVLSLWQDIHDINTDIYCRLLLASNISLTFCLIIHFEFVWISVFVREPYIEIFAKQNYLENLGGLDFLDGKIKQIKHDKLIHLAS